MTQMTQNIHPTPKQRYLQDKAQCDRHMDLLANTHLQTALDVAMSQYAGRLASESTDANSAAASFFKLKGAMEFVHTFHYLAIQAPAPEKINVVNLDHKA